MDDIIEGHLCPNCKVNCDSIDDLFNHFNEKHSDKQDDLNSIIGFVNKAKRKIQIFSDSDDNESNEVNETFLIQEIGQVRSHTHYFRAVRSSKLEFYSAETNRLVIRLDKLLRVVSKPDRKSIEQSIVEWIDDSAVKLCPFCAKSFNISRRKHHCRLCGSIMCQSCTNFLLVQTARKYVDSLIKYNQKNITNDEELNETKEEPLKICNYCSDVLDKKYASFLNHNSKSKLAYFHNELVLLREEIGPLLEQYKKMCDSLHKGERTFTLKEAQDLRKNLNESTDRFRKLNLNVTAVTQSQESSPKFLLLRNALSKTILDFIKSNLLALRELPSAKELESIRKRNEMVIKNWSPAVMKNSAPVETDPVLLQIEIIKNYIQQAQKELKFEEVEILKNNLKDLKEEYKKNQKRLL